MTDRQDRELLPATPGRREVQTLFRLFAYIFIASVMAFLVLPVIFIVWVAFFDSSFLTFPPPGYTLKWFAAAAETRSA